MIQDTVKAIGSELPLVVIQWKQLAVVVSLFAGATIAMATVMYHGWKTVSRAFADGVKTHVTPLVSGLKDEIATLNRNLEHLQMTDLQRAHAIDTSGKRLDEHDDELRDHEIRLVKAQTLLDEALRHPGIERRHSPRSTEA